MAKHFLLCPSPSYHHKRAKPTPDETSPPEQTSRPPPRRKCKAPRDKTYHITNRLTRGGELLTAVAALATLVHPVLAEKTESGSSDRLGSPRPDVPEFLCPALANQQQQRQQQTASVFPQNTPDCWVTHQQRHQQQYHLASSTSDFDESENSYHPYQEERGGVLRSKDPHTLFTASQASFPSSSASSPLKGLSSFTPTLPHDDRPPFPTESSDRLREFRVASLEVEKTEDVESDSYSNTDNANANSYNTAFANARHIDSNHIAGSKTKNDRNNTFVLPNSQLLRRNRRRDFPLSKRSSDDDNDSGFNNEESVDSSAASSAAPTTPAVASSGSSTQCSELYTSRTIPDRYELGNDGRWHKLSVSSSCSLCECQTTNDVDGEANNDLSATGVVNNDTSYEAEDNSLGVSGFTSPTPSSQLDAVTIVLPDGWDRDFNSVVYQVPLIVIASLLVAAAVTSAVWFTFFFKRRQRIAKKLALQRDLEKRKRVADGDDSSDEDDDGDEAARGRVGSGVGGRGGRRSAAAASVGAEGYDGRKREKTSEEKAKARWARATAQWKAHVRWIHRRRRGRASIVDGMKQRDAAMASGVSLAPSAIVSASSSQSQLALPSESSSSAPVAAAEGRRENNAIGSGSGSGSRMGCGNGESEVRPIERGESSSATGAVSDVDADLDIDVEDEVASQSLNFRVRGTRDRRVGNVVPGEGTNGSGALSRDAGPLSDGRRSVLVVVPQDHIQNHNQSRTRQSRRQSRRWRQSSEGRDAEERDDEGYRAAGEDGEVQDTTGRRSSSSRSLRRSRLRPEFDSGNTSSDHAVTASSSFASSSNAPSIPAVVALQDPWAPRGGYDRPPPELCPVERAMAEGEEDEEVQLGPPAYRSRRSADGADTSATGPERRGSRRRRGRRRVCDEKSATACAPSGSGYVPSPGDYAPYSSGESDGEGDIEEAESVGGSRSSSIDRRETSQPDQTSMHVAVDDKQALARLATYASAPPMPSPPPPHPSSLPSTTTPSSRPSSSSLHSLAQGVPVQPNAPPEPEWERFDGCEYPYEHEYGDSPGAGPGPSTISARSRSASPSSTRSSSPRRPSSQTRAQSSFFPAPPQPLPSKLAYAPADAGLVHPSPPPLPPPVNADSEDGYLYYTYGYGYGARDFGFDVGPELDLVESELGPSAPPPFSAGGGPPPAEFGENLVSSGEGVPSAPPEDEFLATASAPPPLDEEDDAGISRPSPSAPPLGVGDEDVHESAPKNSLSLTGLEIVGESPSLSPSSTLPRQDGARVESDSSTPVR